MPVSKKPRKPYAGNRFVLTSREAGKLQVQLNALSSIVRVQGQVILSLHERVFGAAEDPTAIQIAQTLPQEITPRA